MFQRAEFGSTAFADVPLDRDIIVRDEREIEGYEREWTNHFEGKHANLAGGFVSYAAARSVDDEWIELSWYPNILDRFHEVSVFLPKSAFVACVDIWKYDEKPTIFVRSDWLTELHERPLAAFAIVDAIGIKDLLRAGNLHAKSLRHLRDEIDAIADRYPDFGFISFADSLLVKQAWSVGHVGSAIRYTYAPEMLLPVVVELHRAFERALGVKAYAIMTQGLNSYAEHTPLHRSASGNHISLNTLGLPFAQLMAIDDAARQSIRTNVHAPADLYLDSTFFRSLRLKATEKDVFSEYAYRSPMTKSLRSKYIATSLQAIVDQLRETDV
jgi:hypothetical protein